MSTDIVGSTPLSLAIDGEDYAEIIDSYRQVALPLIDRFGGFLGRDEGDGRFIWFGWPRTDSDDATRAVMMALELNAAIQELAPSFRRRFGVEVAARVGVHSGEIIVRSGQGERPDLLGATANIAGKVQAEARPGTVLITESTASLTNGRFELAGTGDLTIGGDEASLPLFEVQGESAQPIGGGTPVGRADELALLADLWDQVRAGDSATVLIVGEAGIGKSSLVRTFLDQHGLDRAWIEIQADSYRQDERFGVLIDGLLRTEVGFDRGEVNSLYRAEDRERAMTALMDRVADHSSREPSIAVVEDAHWLDHSTAELSSRVIQAQPPGLLVIVTSRLSANAMEPSDSTTTITLGPLPRDEVDDIVRNSASGLDDALVKEVIERAGGNPFFAEILAGAYRREPRHSTRRSLLPHSEVPIVVQQALRAQLEGSDSASDLSATAAVIGQEFSVELLTASHDHPSTIAEDLAWLEAASVIEKLDERGNYRFRHALIHQLAYDLPVRASRQHRHVLVADALEAGGGASSTLLGLHYERAGQYREAAAAKLSAAVEARSGGAFREGSDLVGQVLDLIDHHDLDPEHTIETEALELRSVLSAAFDRTTYGANELDRERLSGLLDANVDGLAVVRALTRDWASHMVMSRLRDGAPLLRQMQHLSRHDPPSEAITRLFRGTLMMYRGNFAYAEPLVKDAALDLAALGLQPEFRANWSTADDPVSVALSRVPPLLWVRGQTREAEEFVRLAETEAATISGPGAAMSAAHVKANSALFYELAGQGDRAIELGTEIIDIGREPALAFWEQNGQFHQLIGSILIEPTSDHLAQLHAVARQVEEVARLFAPMMYLETARGYLRLGDHQSALDAVSGAGTIAAETGAHWLFAETCRLRALATADRGEKQQLLTQAASLSYRQGAREYTVRSLADILTFDPTIEIAGRNAPDLAREAVMEFPLQGPNPAVDRLRELVG